MPKIQTNEIVNIMVYYSVIKNLNIFVINRSNISKRFLISEKIYKREHVTAFNTHILIVQI